MLSFTASSAKNPLLIQNPFGDYDTFNVKPTNSRTNFYDHSSLNFESSNDLRRIALEKNALTPIDSSIITIKTPIPGK
jgi:hypothetical protein